MAYADLGEVRLFYTDDAPDAAPGAPSPDPVLLVHGYGADSADWSFHIPALAERRRVIAPDLRGHGRSSAPATGYRTADFTADLVALLDRLGVERVVAIGHSLGTLVVSALAVEHPDRVRALVCVDPGYGQPEEVAAYFPAMYDGLAADPYATALANDAWCYTPASPRWLREWHRRKILGTAPQALAEAFPAMYRGEGAFGVRPAAERYLAGRACPVLSCWSAAQAGSAAWEGGLFKHPASRAEVWPGGGHRLHAERPEEFLFVVGAWLGDIDKEMSA
ncbi:alpha/beta fold hydrolase [Actinomadura parmotrematis]|uniref:Alpha/beta fold hydrolase n=1 Tax=Actinomadura parmotrematis TaxID=2864039 RepID=A0ABS7FUU8_9ACTN|nr:alpha/beta fold hydrolase [Actinomadura parmotrematis]MBW8483735.1 alpha/beta fold hydrolase [Actinomadura parmotrematis]